MFFFSSSEEFLRNKEVRCPDDGLKINIAKDLMRRTPRIYLQEEEVICRGTLMLDVAGDEKPGCGCAEAGRAF